MMAWPQRLQKSSTIRRTCAATLFTIMLMMLARLTVRGVLMTERNFPSMQSQPTCGYSRHTVRFIHLSAAIHAPHVRSVPFCKAQHAAYLMAGLGTLAQGYTSLDASRPWLCYWISHSLEMLGEPHALTGQPAEDVVRFLSRCQVPTTGGFAGGPVPGQLAHLAPTYAAVNTLVTIGTRSALDSIDRKTLKSFLLRMKQPNGSFTMHDDGEVRRERHMIYPSPHLAYFLRPSISCVPLLFSSLLISPVVSVPLFSSSPPSPLA